MDFVYVQVYTVISNVSTQMGDFHSQMHLRGYIFVIYFHLLLRVFRYIWNAYLL